jgi:hypothetical protein
MAHAGSLGSRNGRCRREVVSSLAALAIAVGWIVGGASGAEPAKVPGTQVLTLTSLGLSVVLPADWGRDYGNLGSIKLAAFGPGHIATLDVIAGATTLTLSQQVSNFLAYERQRLGAAGASVSERTTTVGTLPAVLVTLHVHAGVGPAALADGYEFDYLVERGGDIYVFEFDTTAHWLARERPVIAAAAASIRFRQVA